MRHYIRAVEGIDLTSHADLTHPIPDEVTAFYHFTTFKRLLDILQSGDLRPGSNGRVSFTFDPKQKLFRYMPVVLQFSGDLSDDVALTRFTGDAAVLAGGDECEFYATTSVPLRPYLQGIFVKPVTFSDGAKDFKATFGLSKRDVHLRLDQIAATGVKVAVTDFNNTDQTWWQT